MFCFFYFLLHFINNAKLSCIGKAVTQNEENCFFCFVFWYVDISTAILTGLLVVVVVVYLG